MGRDKVGVVCGHGAVGVAWVWLLSDHFLPITSFPPLSSALRPDVCISINIKSLILITCSFVCNHFQESFHVMIFTCYYYCYILLYTLCIYIITCIVLKSYYNYLQITNHSCISITIIIIIHTLKESYFFYLMIFIVKGHI